MHSDQMRKGGISDPSIYYITAAVNHGTLGQILGKEARQRQSLTTSTW